MAPVFSDEALRELDRNYPDGVSAATVVDELRRHGVELAEATFRKYVQLGLLPRSRRVGRKGKHQGSHGLYPVSCVARVAEIRRLMDAGLTLEDIQKSALAVSFEVDTLRRTADDILARLSEELLARGTSRPVTSRKLQSLRTQADALASALEQIAYDICPVPPKVWHTSGVAESPSRGSRTARVVTAGRLSRKKPTGARPGQSRAGAHR